MAIKYDRKYGKFNKGITDYDFSIGESIHFFNVELRLRQKNNNAEVHRLLGTFEGAFIQMSAAHLTGSIRKFH